MLKVFGKEDKEKKFKKRVTTFQTDKNPSKRWKSLIKIIGNKLNRIPFPKILNL